MQVSSRAPMFDPRRSPKPPLTHRHGTCCMHVRRQRDQLCGAVPRAARPRAAAALRAARPCAVADEGHAPGDQSCGAPLWPLPPSPPPPTPGRSWTVLHQRSTNRAAERARNNRRQGVKKKASKFLVCRYPHVRPCLTPADPQNPHEGQKTNHPAQRRRAQANSGGATYFLKMKARRLLLP